MSISISKLSGQVSGRVYKIGQVWNHDKKIQNESSRMIFFHTKVVLKISPIFEKPFGKELSNLTKILLFLVYSFLKRFLSQSLS